MLELTSWTRLATKSTLYRTLWCPKYVCFVPRSWANPGIMTSPPVGTWLPLWSFCTVPNEHNTYGRSSSLLTNWIRPRLSPKSMYTHRLKKKKNQKKLFIFIIKAGISMALHIFFFFPMFRAVNINCVLDVTDYFNLKCIFDYFTAFCEY